MLIWISVMGKGTGNQMGASSNKKVSKKQLDDAGSMDPQAQLKEIQQLLFGQQVAEVRDTIEKLRHQNEKQFADLNKLVNNSVEQLKTSFNHQLDDLAKHVSQLDDAGQKRDDLLQNDIDTLQQDLNNFQEQTAQAQESLEAQLCSESEKLSSEMTEKYQDLLNKLAQQSNSLSDQKADRKTLSALFAGLAASLDDSAH